MTLHEALEVLGLDETADRKTARRAYLKLIRRHKPDREPEKFQQIREAFELCDGMLPAAEAAEGPAEGSALSDASSARSAVVLDAFLAKMGADLFAPQDELQLRQQPQAVEREASDEPEPLTPDPEAAPSDAEAETVARDRHYWLLRTEDDPDDADGWWALYEAERDEEEWALAEQTLRAAANRGHPGFLERMWFECPELLTPDEAFAQAEDKPVAALLILGANLAYGGKLEQAAALAEVAGWRLAELGEVEVPVRPLCDLALHLVAADQRLTAVDLVRAAESAMVDVSVMRREGDHGAMFAQLTLEVVELIDLDAPAGAVRLIAKALGEGDLSTLPATLAGWSSAQPGEVAALKTALARRAPFLNEAVGGGLLVDGATYDYEPPVQAPPAKPASKIGAWVLFIGVAVLIRMCVGMGGGAISNPRSAQTPPPPPRMGAPCTGDRKLCEIVEQVEGDIAGLDCDALKTLSHEVGRAGKDLHNSVGQARLTRLRVLVSLRCSTKIESGEAKGPSSDGGD